MADNNWVSEYKMLWLSGKETGPLGRNLQRTFVPGQYLPCVLGRNRAQKLAFVFVKSSLCNRGLP